MLDSLPEGPECRLACRGRGGKGPGRGVRFFSTSELAVCGGQEPWNQRPGREAIDRAPSTFTLSAIQLKRIRHPLFLTSPG